MTIPIYAILPEEVLGVIYKITNTVNGKLYIGQSIYSSEFRWMGHCASAKFGNPYALCCAIRKHGEESFTIEEIERVLVTDGSKQALHDREIHWIAHFNTYHGEGYNMTLGGEGTEWTDEQKERKRQEMIAWWNEEGRREAWSEYMRKKVQDPDYIEFLSLVSREYWDTPGAREEQSKRMTVFWSDPENRRKHGEKISTKWADPEWRAMVLKAQAEGREAKGDELLQRLSEVSKANWSDPEWAENQIRLQQKGRENMSEEDYLKMCENQGKGVREAYESLPTEEKERRNNILQDSNKAWRDSLTEDGKILFRQTLRNAKDPYDPKTDISGFFSEN